ncbi:MAG: NAD(P)/FAD-dependent oxidoreductase [Myxococcota bacterium]
MNTDVMPTDPTRADIVIVGAGFAGAATAAALVRRGFERVRILEAEPIPGQHGSGRNAAMARRVIADPLMSRLAVDSVEGMHDLERRRDLRFYDRVGGIILGDEEDLAPLREAAAAVPELGRTVEVLPVEDAALRIPLLEGAAAPLALRSRDCGVVDIHALLSALLDEAREGGATLHLGTEVTGVETRDGRVTGVETNHGTFPCDVLVNAAGFRVHAIAEMAGARPVPIQPVRRHLFVTASLPEVQRDWPFVWDVTHGVYFRPEGAGLLMCACDETPWPPADPPTDPAERERLAEKFSEYVPALDDARPTRSWAGLRVMTPDDRFVVGPDPEVEGLFWVAGLGGHGMTTSCGVGEIAAQGIETGRVPAPYDEGFAPGRFQEEDED